MALVWEGRREQHSHSHGHPTRAHGHQPPSPLAPLPLPTLPSAHPSPSQPDFTGQLPLISWVPSTCQMNRQVCENLINLNATAGFSHRLLHLPAPALLAGSARALPWHPRTQYPVPRDHGRSCGRCYTKPLQAGKAAPEREDKGCKFCSMLCSVTACSPGSAGRGAVLWGWSRHHGQPGAIPVSPLPPAWWNWRATLLGPWEGIAWQLHQQLRKRGRNASTSLSVQSWCELRKGYSPFAFYPSVISTLTGAIKRQACRYEAISAERPEY